MKKLLILFMLFGFKAYGQLDTVNIGTGANTGTGDPLRTAFIKVNWSIKKLDSLYQAGAGFIKFKGSTSGTNRLKAPAVAGTTVTTLPSTTGTLIVSADTAAMLTPYILDSESRDAINDSINDLKANAVLGVALADSAVYNGGYPTMKILDDKVHHDYVQALNLLGSNIKAIPLNLSQWGYAAEELGDGRVYYQAVFIRKPVTLTGVTFLMAVQGVYTADNYNGVGLYTYSGGTLTKVAESTNDGDLWKAEAWAQVIKAFSTPYSAKEGIYFVAFVYNQSEITTIPEIAIGLWQTGAVQGFSLTNSAKLNGYAAGATLPATIEMSGVTGNADTYATFLY